MERLTDEKEHTLMYDESNKLNLNRFTELLQYFYLKSSDEKLLVDYSVNKADINNNLYLDDLLSLNDQRRAFFDIGDYDASIESYNKYRRALRNNYNNENIPRAAVRILDDHYHVLTRQDTFTGGFITIGKQKLKLFKYLLKNKKRWH